MLEAYQIIEEILKDIKQQGDFFIIDARENGGYVSYSRHCGGGAYQGAVRFHLSCIGMALRSIASNKLRITFSLTDPISFDKMGIFIKSVIDTMQTDRMNHGSEGGISIHRCLFLDGPRAIALGEE